jgi:hypothetical protein
MTRIRAFALVAICVFALPLLAQTRVRINIDDPSFDLAGYKLAMQILMARDPAHDDPVNWVNNSYTYFAKLHDDFAGGGGCIHGAEVFLPWHREMLFRFEMAIRAAQPGRTDNLTIPYWNWTAPPSGQFYPKAYEDTTSVLYNALRNTPPKGTYTADPIQKMLEAKKTWLAFAGGACTVKPNCVSGNCSSCPSTQFGGLESPFHNNMHTWLGDPMWDPESAVEDPIFWSFHTFIDVIYQEWQCKYPAELPNCPNCNFRSMVDKRVRDVIDIERQLGYRYDIVPSCQPAQPPMPTVLEAVQVTPGITEESVSPAAPAHPLVDRERTISLATAGISNESVGGQTGLGPYIFDVALPPADFETADLRFAGLTLPTQFSYSGHVFLYPPNVQLKPKDADFVSRYRVGEIAVWERSEKEAGMDEHSAHRSASVEVDVTSDMRYLARVNRGATWKVAVVFNPPISVDPPMTAAQAAQQIQVGSARIVLNNDNVSEE